MAIPSDLSPQPTANWRLTRVSLGGSVAFGLIFGFMAVLGGAKPAALVLILISSLAFGMVYLALCTVIFPRVRASSKLRLVLLQILIGVATMTLASSAINGSIIFVREGVWLWTTLPDGRFAIERAWLWVAIPIVPLAGLAVTHFNQSWAPMHALEDRARRADELAAVAQLEALRAQISPHFLFNSLNSIAALIRSDPDRAEECVERLASIFRYMLASKDKASVRLSEEMDITDGYLDIERARFGSLLNVRFEVDPIARDWIVPTLILQPLVENAVRHGLARKQEGISIVIGAHIEGAELILTVEDTGPGMPPASVSRNGAGLGLRNVTERLTHLFGDGYVPQISSRPEQGTTIRLRVPAQ